MPMQSARITRMQAQMMMARITSAMRNARGGKFRIASPVVDH
jgi:hypothetical protein